MTHRTRLALSRRPALTTVASAPKPGAARVRIAAIAVLVAVGVAQIADLLTFVQMVGVAGIGAELNPLVARGAETLGFGALAVVKVALVVLVGAVFTVVARRHRRVAAGVATAGTLAGLIGAFSNVIAIS
jgi:hypothetical protein